MIYHARIPDLSSLPALGKHAVAKPTDFSTPLSQNFQGKTAALSYKETAYLISILDLDVYRPDQQKENESHRPSLYTTTNGFRNYRHYV